VLLSRARPRRTRAALPPWTPWQTSRAGLAFEPCACSVRRARSACEKSARWCFGCAIDGGHGTGARRRGRTGNAAYQQWRRSADGVVVGGVGVVPVFAVPSQESVVGKRKKSAAWPPPLRRPGRRGRPCSSLLLLAACGARRVAAEPRGGGEGDGSTRVRGIGFYSPFRSWLAADGEDAIGTL